MKLLNSLAVVLATAAGGATRLAPATIEYNGTSAVADVIVKDGHAYVSVSSVAKMLHASVEKSGTTYRFVPFDGARQVEGDYGKIGVPVKLGDANITVTDVFVGSTYKHKFSSGDESVDGSKQIVAVSIHIQNTLQEKVVCSLMGGDKTALADTHGHSYGPGTFGDWENRAPFLLPGAAVDFALLFNIPAGEEVKDLVYQMEFVAAGKHKIARIHLVK